MEKRYGMTEHVLVSPFVTDAIVHLRNRLAELDSVAQKLCQCHLDLAITGNKKKNWDDKSVLYAQSRLRDNTLVITWYVVSWYGSKVLNTRRMVKKVIIKPKIKHGYTIASLLNKAQPWEADMVIEIEQAFIPLRREASFLAKAIGRLNQVIKVASKEAAE